MSSHFRSSHDKSGQATADQIVEVMVTESRHEATHDKSAQAMPSKAVSYRVKSSRKAGKAQVKPKSSQVKQASIVPCAPQWQADAQDRSDYSQGSA